MPEAEPTAQPAPLFFERGASWYWLLFGPGLAGLVVLRQGSSSYGALVAPAALMVLVSSMLAIQVKAARIHGSVELTEDTLRQGTEIIRVADIVMIYPEAKRATGWGKVKPEKWQGTRVLGELTGVPRSRVGIGLQLSGRRTVQAWARDHRRLRAALSELVPDTTPPPELTEPDVDDGSPW